jgi:hypothetical protein
MSRIKVFIRKLNAQKKNRENGSFKLMQCGHLWLFKKVDLVRVGEGAEFVIKIRRFNGRDGTGRDGTTIFLSIYKILNIIDKI